MLNKLYTNIRQAYSAKPLAHLGQSDHMSLLLIPAYTPLWKRVPITTRTVTTWPEDASHQLQDCLQRTDWEVFAPRDLENHTTAVLDYIRFCMDNVTRIRCMRFYSKRKPWMTMEVQSLLKFRNNAFTSGDTALYSAARANLRRGICEAKATYRMRIEDLLRSNDTRQVWQGVQHITSYRSRN